MTTATTTATATATVKETAAALRKELRVTFPGTKFSVRMSTGTGHGWLWVSWTDGPSTRAVETITARYVSSRFDGMTDSYHCTGVTEWTCSGVNSTRNVSDEAMAAAMARIEYDTDGHPLISDGDLFVHSRGGIDTDEMVARRFLNMTA